MRPMALFVLLFASFGSLLLGLTACGGESQAGPRGTAESPWVIGMSQCNVQEPWRKQMNTDLEQAAAQHPELRLVIKDAGNDSRRQQAQVAEFVDMGVDLIVISPKESVPLTKPVADAMDRGVPVIVLDREVMGERFTCFIGGDNVAIGRAAGRWIKETLGGAGNIVELKGLMTSTPGQDRHKGFVEGAGIGSEDSRLEVVFDADMKWLEQEARKEMASALAVHSKIDLVYAHNDPAAHGAWLAAKQAGRHEEMRFVGIDALPHEGVRYVREGILDATFLYPTGGARAIEVALDVLKGQEVPKRIVLGTRLFTKESVEQGGVEIR